MVTLTEEIPNERLLFFVQWYGFFVASFGKFSLANSVAFLCNSRGLLYPDRISDLRWSDNMGSKGSMIPAASSV